MPKYISKNEELLGRTPPYPLYFNPELTFKDTLLFAEGFQIDDWTCEFIQLNEQAQRLGIFKITSDDRLIFLAFSDEDLSNAYRALFKLKTSPNNIDEEIRRFEMIRPVCFNLPFNLENFNEVSHEMSTLSDVLLKCYDEINEQLNIIVGQDAFEKVLQKVISDHMKLMTPKSPTN